MLQKQARSKVPSSDLNLVVLDAGPPSNVGLERRKQTESDAYPKLVMNSCRLSCSEPAGRRGSKARSKASSFKP